MVKICLIPNDFYTKDVDFEEVLEFCTKESVKFIEIASLWGKSVLDMEENEIEKVKTLLNSAGVQVGSVQTQIMKTVTPFGSFFTRLFGRIVSFFYGSLGKQNMHGNYEYNISRIDDAIQIAKEFNSDYIITYSYFTKGAKIDEKTWNRLIADYKVLASKCETEKKTLVIECEGDTFIQDTRTYLKLFNEVNSPYVKANLDLSNFVSHVGDFTRDDFEALKEHVEYFHVKDRKGNMGSVFGEGDIPWKKVLPWFIDAGYDGFLSVEPHVHGRDKFNRAKQCVLNLKQMLEELGIEYE